MTEILLHEAEATVLVFELCDFAELATEMRPLDLVGVLAPFYEHAADLAERAGAREVKFAGGSVAAVFERGPSGTDHAGAALGALGAAIERQPHWLEESRGRGLRSLAYTLGLASGIVLVGHVGTEAAKNLDVLGAPMLLAGKLAELAHARRSGHLCARRTFDLTPAQMRVADAGSIDFGGTAVPLCRLEAVAGQALALADPPSAGGRGGG